MERDLMVKRKTAAKYLDMIVDAGLLTKKKFGYFNYYINSELVSLFVGQGKAGKKFGKLKTKNMMLKKKEFFR